MNMGMGICRQWLLTCGWIWTFQTSIDLKFSNWSMLIEVCSTWLGSSYMFVLLNYKISSSRIGKLHSPGNTILDFIPLFALVLIPFNVLGGFEAPRLRLVENVCFALNTFVRISTPLTMFSTLNYFYTYFTLTLHSQLETFICNIL